MVGMRFLLKAVWVMGATSPRYSPMASLWLALGPPL